MASYRVKNIYVHHENQILNAVSLVMNWAPGNMQPRDGPREPHSNWDGIFYSIQPYLNIKHHWLLVVKRGSIVFT